ncbi:hypothetical protein IWW50_002631 [Coemansia erecta]|nr:hypothetical protein IWW50_002631 [Coemansia erecta]
MSAGALVKEHHVARNGALPAHMEKKGGAGKYNWGGEMYEVDELEYRDEIDNNYELNQDMMSHPFAPQSKVRVASRKEFNEARMSSSV